MSSQFIIQVLPDNKYLCNGRSLNKYVSELQLLSFVTFWYAVIAKLIFFVWLKSAFHELFLSCMEAALSIGYQ